MVKCFGRIHSVNVYLASELAPDVIPGYCPFDSAEEIIRKVTEWALSHNCAISNQNDSVFTAVEQAQSVGQDTVVLLDIK